MNYKVFQGDSLQVLKALPDKCVHTCVTSPPYFGLRDYGVDGQIGLEETPDAYVAKLVEVFREVRRVLRDDGTLWLNIGDSYAANRSYQVSDGKHRSHDFGKSNAARVPDGLKPKDLIGIPWRVAFALQQDGWYLRQDIIRHKPNPMPESVKDRCTKAHEYIFLLSKSQSYFFDSEALKEPVAAATVKRAKTLNKGDARKDGGAAKDQCGLTPENQTAYYSGISETSMRNRRSVWTVTTKPYKGAHFATFPKDLVEPCIMAGCPVGGVVLDPFSGSGTTLQVAVESGRYGIGVELNPEYVKLIHERMKVVDTKLI